MSIQCRIFFQEHTIVLIEINLNRAFVAPTHVPTFKWSAGCYKQVLTSSTVLFGP